MDGAMASAHRAWLIRAVVLVQFGLWSTPAGGAPETSDRMSRTLTIQAATPIYVDATIADLTITGSDRADLAVAIVRRAPSNADLTKIPVVIDDSSGSLHISVVQPDEGRDPGLKAEIEISAPSGAVFQAVRVFEGRVKVSNLKKAVDIDIRRGPIDATGLAGHVRLESGIGSIDLKQPELTAGGMMRVRIFNGPIHIRFPRPPANARILAVTFNGTLTSDIPLTMKDKFGPRFGETTLGTGDPVMSIDDVKGDIAIKVG